MEDLKTRIELNTHLSSQVWDRIVLISDFMFEHIVNDHLEIRTSVAIDPATGAAEDGALFSFEALPRSSVLTFELTVTNPVYFKIQNESLKKDDDTDLTLDIVLEHAKMGFDYLPILGLGGMGSRGLGRVSVIAENGEEVPS
ncbi:hypothetical protein GF406_22095 [candidate division KSB1 bacterium]|nr:hypothetical protein [candidate division KSB1 bacterium]